MGASLLKSGCQYENQIKTILLANKSYQMEIRHFLTKTAQKLIIARPKQKYINAGVRISSLKILLF
jgi:hypothetical protein